jgi:hypothetical protein
LKLRSTKEEAQADRLVRDTLKHALRTQMDDAPLFAVKDEYLSPGLS